MTICPPRPRCALGMILVAALTLGALPARAGNEPPPLEPGLSMAEVLDLWGAPLEKIEREASRRDEWRYAGGEVLFHQGRVERWSVTAGVDAEEPKLLPLPEVAAAAGSAETPPPGTVTDGAVREILDEILAEGGAPDAPSAPGVPQPPAS